MKAEIALFVASAAALVLMLALHLSSAFVYLPYWLAFALTVLALAVLLSRAATPRALVAATVVTCFLLVLPWFPITLKNRFYLDCRSIKQGMAVATAQERMSSYSLQRDFAGKMSPTAKLERAHLTYHPSKGKSSDWCVIYVSSGFVTEVEALPD